MKWILQVLLLMLTFVLELTTSNHHPHSIRSLECSGTSSPNTVIHVADLSTLVFAQVVFRHGDRTPLDPYPSDPYKYPDYWPEGEGQLTKAGKKMSYELGKYLRFRYDLFLSRIYTSKEVHAQSSDFDRTIMSAQGCLAGLFPPLADESQDYNRWSRELNWQPIPVHTIPLLHDNKIAFLNYLCPSYQEMIYEVGNSTLIKQIDFQNKNLYSYLSKHTGIVELDWREVGQIYDTLFIEKVHGLPLPHWTHSVYPDRMYQLLLLPFKLISFTKEMRRLRGGPLLEEMIDNMEKTILLLETQPQQQQSSLPAPATSLENQLQLNTKAKRFKPAKLYMYSGHDTTITALLAAMDIYEYDHLPPYASMVMMELHRSRETGEYFIRLFYRNETDGRPPMELTVPNCHNQCNLCLLSKFKTLMEDTISTNWKAECYERPPPGGIRPPPCRIATATNSAKTLGEICSTMIQAQQMDSITQAALSVSEEMYELYIRPLVQLYYKIEGCLWTWWNEGQNS